MRAGAKADSWLISATSAVPGSGEPAVGADHRHAAVVAVERVTALALEPAVDRRASARRPRTRPCAERWPTNVLSGLDQVHLAGRAEPGRLEHDPVEPLEVQIGCELADLLAVLVEQRRADRDRRMARELGVRDRLHGRDRRSSPGRSTARAPDEAPSCAGVVDSRTMPFWSRTRYSSASAVWLTTPFSVREDRVVRRAARRRGARRGRRAARATAASAAGRPPTRCRRGAARRRRRSGARRRSSC